MERDDNKLEGRRGPSASEHMPLPYVVRLRMVIGQDAPPQVVESRVVAYSVFEAAMQAGMEHGGKVDGVDFRVESVAPDVEAYWRLFGQALAHAVSAVRK